MKHNTGWLSSNDNSKLFYQSWRLEGDAPVVIALVHGAGEHSGRYSHLIEYFVQRNYCVYGFDFRGHGKSTGRTGHVLSWQEYRDDLNSYLQRVVEENPGAKVFLYGHSMGGQVALDYLSLDYLSLDYLGLNYPSKGKSEIDHPNRNRLSGVIVSAPAIAQPSISPALLRIGRLLSIMWPTFPLDNGLDVKDISRDVEEVKAYSEDSLVSSRITARFGAEFIDAISRVQGNADGISLPLFIFHGEDDNIIPVQGSRDYFSKVDFEDKTLKTYSGGFHEPHNDLQKLEVFRDVQQWLEMHTC